MQLKGIITDLKFTNIALMIQYLTKQGCAYYLNQATHEAVITYPDGDRISYFLVEQDGQTFLCHNRV